MQKDLSTSAHAHRRGLSSILREIFVLRSYCLCGRTVLVITPASTGAHGATTLKFLIFLFAIALLLTAVPAAATAASDDGDPDEALDSPPQWTISVDPLTAVLGYPHLQFERSINDRLSIYAGPHLRLYDNLLDDETEPYRGYGAEFGVRWFPFRTGPSGPWLSARTVTAHLRTHAPAEPSSEFGGYSSVLAGYTYFPTDWFVVSGGLGVQYLYYDIDDFGTRSPFVAMHTVFGFAF